MSYKKTFEHELIGTIYAYYNVYNTYYETLNLHSLENNRCKIMNEIVTKYDLGYFEFGYEVGSYYHDKILNKIFITDFFEATQPVTIKINGNHELLYNIMYNEDKMFWHKLLHFIF